MSEYMSPLMFIYKDLYFDMKAALESASLCDHDEILPLLNRIAVFEDEDNVQP